ncbi:MAG: excinuclease ABC subunit UvrC [Flavobacteriia bacterium]|nr:excinuclease ABC subunit UvrC [Flavobacteriia bacterium]
MPENPISVQLSVLPENPGVYQFYDKVGKIIYIGKAKNLKKRVASYFTLTHEVAKTRLLVKKIVEIKHIVVPTESDALLLENNLIKKYQPRYNILLKDDKSFPWICIKKERFPRVFVTRRLVKDGSEYFGPYTNKKMVKVLFELLKGLYPLRTCNYDLSYEKLAQEKYKACLEYHLGNCKAPCESLQSETEYQKDIAAIRHILKGNLSVAIKYFKEEMEGFAASQAFEKAQQVKEKLEVLANYQAKSTIVNPKISNVDVFSIVSDSTHAYVNFLELAHGAIIRSHTLEMKKQLDESDQELLQLAVIEIKNRFASISKEALLPFKILLPEGLKATVPVLGDKLKLVELSQRNAKYYRQDKLSQMRMVDPERHSKRIVAQIQEDLRLSDLPTHIECFDNSNIQGTHPVAACVVFINAKPNKKMYRHFHVKTVTGPDDFASMEEVVYRRYKRLLEEGASLPQLIVIDGGKGQLSSALTALEQLNLRGKIAIVGIAKRLEEIYFPDDPIPLYLDKKSESLKVIQQLRNEAHRFGITFHRNLRSKDAIHSELDDIKGVGEKTATDLLKAFKSVGQIKEAGLDALIGVVGPAKAKIIYEHFH